MARKLPWNVSDQAKSKGRLQPGTIQPKIKASTTSSSDHDHDTPVKITASSAEDKSPKRKRPRSRSNSTSPITGPPDSELMREGYRHDDIYIMVEDEFQSVAQSFTRHLHHAEYRRLQKKAREAPPKEAVLPSADMRIETRKKIEALALRHLQDGSLKGILGGSNSQAQRIGLESDEDDDGPVNDPWAGTALAGLMGSSTQQKTALAGLKQIGSSTKAAKGLTQGVREISKKADLHSLDQILGGKGKRVARGAKIEISDAEGEGEEEDDDDDLDATPPSRTFPAKFVKQPSKFNHTNVPPQPPPSLLESKDIKPAPTRVRYPTLSGGSTSAIVNPKSRTVLRDFLDDFDEFDHKALLQPSSPAASSAQPHLKTETESPAKRRAMEEGKRKARLKEIPTFLV